MKGKGDAARKDGEERKKKMGKMEMGQGKMERMKGGKLGNTMEENC